MYLAIDIGGTKTLVASFDASGRLNQPLKFPTPKSYNQFLAALKSSLLTLKANGFKTACVAIPGKIDREHGIALGLGNLPWENEPIAKDVEDLVGCPVIIENDAKIAGLYEATQLKDKYKKVLYITIGTGIGVALITSMQIDDSISDWGGKFLPVERGGNETTWEEIASGRAITKTYGKKASEITEPEIWHKISRNISKGLTELIAITEPEAVVIGGGIGKHFNRFGAFLNKDLQKHDLPAHPMPPVLPAVNAEEAVLYGCFELLKIGAKVYV